MKIFFKQRKTNKQNKGSNKLKGNTGKQKFKKKYGKYRNNQQSDNRKL